MPQMNNESHQRMTFTMQSVTPQLTQQQLFPGFPPPFTNQPAQPLHTSHDRNGVFTSDDQCATTMPRPPQYQSSTRGPFEGPSRSFQQHPEPSSTGPSNPLDFQTAVPGLVKSFGREQNQADGRDGQGVVQGNGLAIRKDAKRSFDEAIGDKEGSPRTKRKAGVQIKTILTN